MDTPFMDRVPAQLQSYWPDMWKVMTFSWQQATTVPTGIHAEFIQHGVDAVTIDTYTQPSEVTSLSLCAHIGLYTHGQTCTAAGIPVR